MFRSGWVIVRSTHGERLDLYPQMVSDGNTPSLAGVLPAAWEMLVWNCHSHLKNTANLVEVLSFQNMVLFL